MKRTPTVLIGAILAVTIASAALYASARPTADISDALVDTKPTLLPQASDIVLTDHTVVRAPVPEFFERIIKKPFGIYITPDTSPVENDHFTGFHTGVDAEFTDTTQDIPVYAIADGTIVVHQWVKGYGGVIVIRHIINDVPLYALYGHLNVASFGPADELTVTAGQQIAILGHDHSEETDGVRKHLHFSISKTDTLDLRGYVQTEDELTHWLNPLDFFSF